jgi:hypothetical protein
MSKSTTARRTLACALLGALTLLSLPALAAASPGQLSLIQDDSELFSDRGGDPVTAIDEIRDLGVDVLRTNVLFYRIYQGPETRRKPAGFDPSDPNDPLYSWAITDRVVELASSRGLDLMLTVSGPGPRWTSQKPGTCKPNEICTTRPNPRWFGDFAAAVAKRYKGKADYYSLYNEPNLHTWITPQTKRTRAGVVSVAGIYYRKLWQAGYRSIARYDKARRGRVLFGEVAAIGNPLTLLGAALCLDYTGKPLRGALARKHQCRRRGPRLKIGGYAVHPYNSFAIGTPRTKVPRSSKASLTQAYMPRLHRFMRNAQRAGRTPRNRGIYITEFGYQSRPPERLSNVSLRQQAQYVNESDRLFFGDRRIKSVAQYLIQDIPEVDQFNTGLRFSPSRGGREKPAYDAYRLPIVVTRRSARRVEVYGQVRPSTLPGVPARVTIQMRRGGGWRNVGNATGNARGIFRRNLSRPGAARAKWRLVWQSPISGTLETSRVAKAGKPLRYYRN